MSGPLSQSRTLYKTLHQVSVIARQSFTLEDEAGSHVFTPPPSVKLMRSFFQEYACLPLCAGCCPHFTLEYLPHDVPEGKSDQAFTRHVSIDGTSVQYIELRNPAQQVYNRKFCGFLETQDPDRIGMCNLHPARPYSCHIEPIKLHVVKNVGYIHKRPFGRGWAMQRVTGEKGALCEFERQPLTPKAIEQGYTNDIPALLRLQAWVDHLGIDTYLPDIIAQVESILRKGHMDADITWPSLYRKAI